MANQQVVTPGRVRNTSLNLENKLIGGKYRVVKPIGSGSFGDIYLGLSVKDASEVAIKVEANDAKYPQLMYEAKVYEQLNRTPGFPKLLHYGSEKNFNAMVIELLGPSLEELFNVCKRRFSLKTVLMITDQLLMRIECVHELGFIHRDIKPDNFLMGVGSHCICAYVCVCVVAAALCVWVNFICVCQILWPETHRHSYRCTELALLLALLFRRLSFVLGK